MNLSEIRSLGYRTDFSILKPHSEILERPHYLVIVTRSNPRYFWGNLLFFREPPKEGDFSRWCDLFRKEFQKHPEVKHITIAWDSPGGETGVIAPFLEAGFHSDPATILTLQSKDLKLPPKIAAVSVRALQTDEDWEQATLNQIRCNEGEHPSDHFEKFKRSQMQSYRALAGMGLGNWYGAFLDDQLVADCGLFVFDQVARFQSVGTHPDFRRRGICGTLVHQVALEGLKQAQTLVIAAEPDYHAFGIYRSIGFRPTEKQVGVCRWP